MSIKGPSGAGEADLEALLAQLLAGASAEEVLEAIPPPAPAEAPAPGAEAKSAPAGNTQWERFSASAPSRLPVSSSAPGSVLRARIELLKK